MHSLLADNTRTYVCTWSCIKYSQPCTEVIAIQPQTHRTPPRIGNHTRYGVCIYVRTYAWADKAHQKFISVGFYSVQNCKLFLAQFNSLHIRTVHTFVQHIDTHMYVCTHACIYTFINVYIQYVCMYYIQYVCMYHIQYVCMYHIQYVLYVHKTNMHDN